VDPSNLRSWLIEKEAEIKRRNVSTELGFGLANSN